MTKQELMECKLRLWEDFGNGKIEPMDAFEKLSDKIEQLNESICTIIEHHGLDYNPSFGCCSNCNFGDYLDDWDGRNFCPVCGWGIKGSNWQKY